MRARIGSDRRWRAGVLAAALAAMLSGGATAETECVAGAEWAGAPLHQDVALPPTEHFRSPDARSFDTATRQRLDAALDRAAGGAVVGASLLAADGRAWSGHTDPPAGTRFQAGSLVKSFAAVVALQLVEEGRLSLDDTLDRWHPEVPNAALITVDDLLRHTGGLSVPPDGELAGPYVPWAMQIAALDGSHIRFCPGTDWGYSNIGYLLLGSVIEQVEERPFGASVEARIVAPLGLENTSIPRPGVREADAVQGHRDGVASPDTDYATTGAAGALLTTPENLTRYWRAVLGGELLPPHARERLVSPLARWFGADRLGYGRGAMVYFLPDGHPMGPGVMIGHSGSITGFSAVLVYLEAHDLFASVISADRGLSADDILLELVTALSTDGETPTD